MNISKQAIEAGAKANWVYNGFAPEHWNEHHKKDGWLEEAEAMLTAALEHIIPAKCGSDIVNVFQLAYNQESAANGVNAREAGINAVLSHLRGEGKQAEASTPPTVKECLTVEPNPDDVERVARAMFDRAAWKYGWKVGWDGQTEKTRDSYRDAATAAIRATNGQLWGIQYQDSKRWLSCDGKIHGPPMLFANEASAGRMKRHYDDQMGSDSEPVEVRPYTAPREESAEEIAKRELQDIADNGLRCDTNPTIQITTSANETALRYVQYIRQIDSTMRDRAKSALEAIRESEKRGTAKCG